MTNKGAGDDKDPETSADKEVHQLLEAYYSEKDPDVIFDRRFDALLDLAYGPGFRQRLAKIIQFPRKRDH